MMNTKFAKLSLTVLLTFLLALVGGVTPAAATHVDPVFVSGNPTCTGLGYSFGFKPQPEPPPSGTYGLPDGINSVTITSDGTFFDWTSTLGIDAVIVKGGPNANVYIYDPEATSDTGLHSPANPSGGFAAISHIEFCYDYELTASKTANAEFTRTYSWTIDKTVDDDSHAGFTGDSFTSNYDVIVDQTVTDSDFAVSGEITVNNPTPFTVGFSVSDLVDGTAATVSCPTYSLAPGASTTCTYSADLGDTNPGDGTNTATITSNNANVDGASASANYAFGAPTTTVGYPTINVTDTLGGDLGSASGDYTFEYSVTFTCDEDQGENPNTATIDETGQTASESVTVNCYQLTVTKDATTSFDREWDWTIEKTGDQTDLTLSTGQSFLVNYQVIVSATYTDSNWAVSGNISVHNPAPIDATINSVTDVVSPDITASVDCGVTFPYELPAGETLPCTYSANLPDGSSRKNTATANLQNTPSGDTDFTSEEVDVTFGSPTNEEDECVDVVDDHGGFLGQFCASIGDQSYTFNYGLTVGPYAECGEYTFVNVATFTTNDTSTTDYDNHTVNVNVPCLGCTLTQGYWKTHSLHGPAPYDDTWAQLPNGASTPFFLSGKTWYEVFWTPPAGNAYYNLAHQYMAARLNVLNGASAPAEVQTALGQAETLFITYTPAQVAALKANNTVRKQFVELASTLDKYNNGLIGPGHCSE